MQTRERRGRYTGHNTPGDGTGFSKVPTSNDPYVVLTEPESGAQDVENPRAERGEKE